MRCCVYCIIKHTNIWVMISLDTKKRWHTNYLKTHNHVYRESQYYYEHTFVNDQTLRGPLLFFPLSLYLTHSHRLCTRMTSEDRWEQRTDSRGPIVPIEQCPPGMAIPVHQDRFIYNKKVCVNEHDERRCVYSACSCPTIQKLIAVWFCLVSQLAVKLYQ